MLLDDLPSDEFVDVLSEIRVEVGSLCQRTQTCRLLPRAHRVCWWQPMLGLKDADLPGTSEPFRKHMYYGGIYVVYAVADILECTRNRASHLGHILLFFPTLVGISISENAILNRSGTFQCMFVSATQVAIVQDAENLVAALHVFVTAHGCTGQDADVCGENHTGKGYDRTWVMAESLLSNYAAP